MVTRKEYEAATAEGSRMLATIPHAVAARYDQHADRIVIALNTGIEVGFSPRNAQGLDNATAGQLAEIEITPPGFSLHWPKLDADLYVPAILQGILGSRRWMAAQLGAVGGRSRSKVKAAASRENGKRGGRPPEKLQRAHSARARMRRRKRKAPSPATRTRKRA